MKQWKQDRDAEATATAVLDACLEEFFAEPQQQEAALPVAAEPKNPAVPCGEAAPGRGCVSRAAPTLLATEVPSVTVDLLASGSSFCVLHSVLSGYSICC